MDNAVKDTDKKLLTYLDDLSKIKSTHPEIQIVMKNAMEVMEQLRIPLNQSMTNIMQYDKEIKEETGEESEYGSIYFNIPLISKTIPSYQREQQNLRTLKQKQIANLVETIKKLIDAMNEISSQIKEVSVPQKEVMAEPDKKAFESIQSIDILKLTKVKKKTSFTMLKKQITDRAETPEQKLLTDNISRRILGKKIEEEEWKMGKKH